MPIYEYECPVCGVFEHIQSFSAKPLTQCPTCKENGQKSKVKRLMSASAFHLKGGGWYKTDYASPNKSKVKKESTGESSEGSKGAETPATSAPKACGGSCACH
jgi:putative FmdB family regulatory protein